MLTKLKKHVTPKQIWNDLVFFALLNLGLIFVEIAMLFKLEHWVLPVTVLTFAICLLNFREVFAMVEKLLGMVLHRRKKSN